MKNAASISAICLLGLLAACGGGGSNPPAPSAATKLTYTDPTSGTYQLKRNSSLSTDGHLVLELWGPAATNGAGITVTFGLNSSAATWHGVQSTTDLVANGTAFDLGTGTPILKAKVTGNTLVATVAQKGWASPKPLNQALLRVALDLQSGTTAGTTIALTPDPANCKILQADGNISSPITITASPITAQ